MCEGKNGAPGQYLYLVYHMRASPVELYTMDQTGSTWVQASEARYFPFSRLTGPSIANNAPHYFHHCQRMRKSLTYVACLGAGPFLEYEAGRFDMLS